MEEYSVDFTEVVFARAEGRRGRFLRIGEEDVALYQAVEDALISRLGMTGVMQVALDDENIVAVSEEKWAVASDVDWLVIPILHPNKRLAYYLLGTFKKPTAHDRGAPFHGCLVIASELENFDYDLRYFIYAWKNLRQENSQWLTTEESAGKVILYLKTDLELTREENYSKLAHKNFNQLKEGAVIRLPHKRDIFSILYLLVKNPLALSYYSWTTAAFAFQDDPDGAQLHIALSKDRQFEVVQETIMPTLLEEIQEDETFPKETKEKFIPSNVAEKKEPTSQNTTERQTSAPPKTGQKKSGVFVNFGILVITLVAVLWLTLTYMGGGDSMAPKEIARRLEPTYEQSLVKNVETVELALSFLQNPQGEQDIKDQIESQQLIPLRVNKVQQQVEKKVKENWELIETDALVQRWLLVLKELPDPNQSQKLHSKVVQSAMLGIQHAIDSIKLKTPEKRESKNKNMFFSMLSYFGTLVLLKSQCTTTISD